MIGKMMSNAACRPPVGKTYLTIGQDLFSIEEYLDGQYNYSLHVNNSTTMVAASSRTRTTFAPAAVMVYTDIQKLYGLYSPVDYGSGVEYADGLLDSMLILPHDDDDDDHHHQSSSVGLQIGLWLNGTQGCRDMLSGNLRDEINTLFAYLKDCKASQVFLRVGYEFDNPSFGYSDPKLYQQAFQLLVKTCRDHQSWKCLDKVKFVWHSWGAASTEPLANYYPGDDYVDWVGISIFQQVYPHNNIHYVEQVLDFAALHDKPTMIAESTPFGGITNSWNDWFGPVLDLINRYDIDMWSYINCDWESQPMWHSTGFGETRLSTSREIMTKWHTLVVNGNRFLGAGSLNDYCNVTPSPKVISRPPSTISLPLAVTVFLFCNITAIVWAWRRLRRRTAHRYVAMDSPCSSLDDEETPLLQRKE